MREERREPRWRMNGREAGWLKGGRKAMAKDATIPAASNLQLSADQIQYGLDQNPNHKRMNHLTES